MWLSRVSPPWAASCGGAGLLAGVVVSSVLGLREAAQRREAERRERERLEAERKERERLEAERKERERLEAERRERERLEREEAERKRQEELERQRQAAADACVARRQSSTCTGR